MGPMGPMSPMGPMGPMGPWALGPESDLWDLDYYKIQNPDFWIFKMHLSHHCWYQWTPGPFPSEPHRKVSMTRSPLASLGIHGDINRKKIFSPSKMARESRHPIKTEIKISQNQKFRFLPSQPSQASQANHVRSCRQWGALRAKQQSLNH